MLLPTVRGTRCTFVAHQWRPPSERWQLVALTRNWPALLAGSQSTEAMQQPVEQ
jgi:hypothetical protein